MHGLDRRNVGAVAVFAHSVSGAAPAAAMAATPAIVATTAGAWTVASFVMATVLALLVAGSIAQFARRMAAAGGLYPLTAKGLTPGAAFACAVALLVGYGLLAAAAVTGAAAYLGSLLTRIGVQPPAVVLAAVVALLGCGVGALAVRGVRVSARVVLLVEAVSVTLMLAVFAVLLLSGPVPGAMSTADPAPPDLLGVTAGVLPAAAAFVGFEAATALSVEARHPFRTVPRALQLTVLVAGVLYVLASWVQVAGLAPVGGLAGQDTPVITLATRHGWPFIPVVLDVGIGASFLACTLVAMNALARVLFSLARDGVAPPRLGTTHHRFRTPHRALVLGLPVVVGGPVALLAAGVPPIGAVAGLLTLATVGFLVAYLLVCLAAPLFLRRIGELTRPAAVASMVATPALVAALVAFIVVGGTRVVAGLGATAVVGAAWYAWLRLRRPGRLAAIGAYDETVAADLHPGVPTGSSG
jgi:amino acid transporter